MKRLFAFIVAASLCFPSIGALAWWQSIQQVGVGSATCPSAGVLCYSFRSSYSGGGTGSTRTFSIDIGTASADRLIVAVVCSQNAAPSGTVTMNSVTLTQDVYGSPATNGCGIYSGLVTTGSGAQTFIINGAGSFTTTAGSVWALTGLTSNVVKNTGSSLSGGVVTINVTAGDFLFNGTYGTSTPCVYTTSTEVPAAVHSAATVVSSADWIIASTNASFLIHAFSCVAAGSAGATYR